MYLKDLRPCLLIPSTWCQNCMIKCQSTKPVSRTSQAPHYSPLTKKSLPKYPTNQVTSITLLRGEHPALLKRKVQIQLPKKTLATAKPHIWFRELNWLADQPNRDQHCAILHDPIAHCAHYLQIWQPYLVKAEDPKECLRRAAQLKRPHISNVVATYLSQLIIQTWVNLRSELERLSCFYWTLRSSRSADYICLWLKMPSHHYTRVSNNLHSKFDLEAIIFLKKTTLQIHFSSISISDNPHRFPSKTKPFPTLPSHPPTSPVSPAPHHPASTPSNWTPQLHLFLKSFPIETMRQQQHSYHITNAKLPSRPSHRHRCQKAGLTTEESVSGRLQKIRVKKMTQMPGVMIF